MVSKKTFKLEELREEIGMKGSQKIPRVTGKIKTIVREKRYGFIEVSGVEKDIYFRLGDCEGMDLKVGTVLEFEITTRDDGKKSAKNLSTPGGAIVTSANKEDKDLPHSYFIPADTLSILKSQKGEVIVAIDNFGLQFEKYPHFQKQEGASSKKFAFSESGVLRFNYGIEKAVELLKSRGNSFATMDRIFKESLAFDLTIDWRMIIGLGSESVYETAMTFHPIYGIPYIPGQALKGIARSWMIKNEIADVMDLDSKDENSDKKLEAKAQKNKLFCYLFGCTKESILGKDYQGCITFLDSYPIDLNKDSLVVDVMNPHYGPYYSDGKPPADYYNPIPVFFLTVENTSFKFVLGLNRRCHKEIENEKGEKVDILNKAKELLVDALKNQGVGAKTAVGYGYFQDKTE